MTLLTLLLLSSSAFAVEGRIYLAGPFNYYGFVGFSDQWELSSSDGTVYTGTFFIPADKLIFCFYDFVAEGDYAIYGSSAREGNRIPMKFEQADGVFSASVESMGQGDWAYEDFPGGEVSFTIDFGLEYPQVSVVTSVDLMGEENGIATVEDLQEEELFFTIDGQKVAPAQSRPGFFVSKGKKVLITK